jgi:hypothetical protein
MIANQRLTLTELVDRESREIAKEILEKRLAEQDLPLPESGIDIHINELLSVSPRIREAARERVELRLDAYSKALKAIGIDPTPIEAMEL